MRKNDLKKELLLEFLDKRVFDPVLEATPDLYSSERDKANLELVKMNIERERDYFHNRSLSAEEIKNHYFRELYYESRHSIGKELEDLELPRFIELRDEFVSLCDELHI